MNPESAAKPYSDGAWSMEIEVDVRTRDSLMGERDLASVDALKLHFQGNELKKGGGRSMLAGLRVLFLESTGMEIDSVALVVPFTREAGFRYLHIAGEGKMGAAIMLIREALPTGLWTVQIFDRGDAV